MVEMLEFYNNPDGTIYVKENGKYGHIYQESDADITEMMIDRIKALYPQAYEALAELYHGSKPNKPFFAFKIASRFIRCNFGENDMLAWDVDSCRFNIEEVRCPLRGECKHEGIICKPKQLSILSDREKEVAKLLSTGYSKQQVATMLNISLNTVSNHIANIKARMGFSSTNQIIATQW